MISATKKVRRLGCHTGLSCWGVKALLLPAFSAWLLLVQRPARATDATPASARLEVVKGPDAAQCIDQKALTQAVEVRLQRPAFDERLPATLRVRVNLERQPAGWTAELTMLDGSGVFLGQRSLVTAARHCSALDDSLALVVALLVDAPPRPPLAEPTQPMQPTGPASAPSQPVQPPEATPAPATIRVPRDTPARREPWRFNVSGEGIAAFGILPGVGWGAELGLGAKSPLLPELRVFVGIYAERDEPRAAANSGANSGARFGFANLGLELCPLGIPLGPLRWFGCAGQALGRLRVTAYGFDENTTTHHLTYALLARTGLEMPLFSRLSARLAARAELPLARGVFSYGARDGSERGLFETKPVTAVLDLGLIVQL